MPSIKGRNVRQMWTDSGARLGPFRAQFRKMLGLRTNPKTGRNYVDGKEAQVSPDEFSLRELTEAFLGHEYLSELHDGPPSGSKAQTMAMALHESTSARMLMEDVAAVGPSIFQDINAWNATVAGLVEVRLLEAYNQAQHIADQFMEVQPTRVNGGKMVGIPYVAPAADVVTPGIEFPTVGMNEMWVWARPNMVYGAKLGLDRNTVVYDLTGELMSKAESIGAGLGYGREYYCGANILGLNNVVPSAPYPKPSLTNQIGDSFRMNQTIDSTPNTTYQTSGSTGNPNLPQAYNYINKTSGGPFTDWTSLQTPRKLLNLMRDPVNQLPFDTDIRKVWVDPYEFDVALRVLHAQQVLGSTGTPATNYGGLQQGAGSTFPPVLTQGANVPPGSRLLPFSLHTSNIWHQILLDSGVSEANAEKYFLVGDPQKAFVWRSAWDTRVDQANPSSADLLGRNIVNEWVAQFSGQFVVREPRYVVLVTN